MRLSFRLNGKQVETDVRPDMLLLDLVRDLGCYSVKRGCETANCGLCTVWLDGKPVLSCSTLAIRADGRHVTTLEGLQKEAEEFGMFLAREGGEQCGIYTDQSCYRKEIPSDRRSCCKERRKGTGNR